MTEQCSFRGGDGLHLCFPEVRIKDMTVVRLCLYFWTICVNSPKSIVLFNFFCNFVRILSFSLYKGSLGN